MSQSKNLYTKRPITVEASQWFKNGDHPADRAEEMFDYPSGQRPSVICEGAVVRYYRHPDVPGDKLCEQCGKPHHAHGWINTLEQGHRVCPGDWIITGVAGEMYPCKPAIFEATYTLAAIAAAPAHDLDAAIAPQPPAQAQDDARKPLTDKQVLSALASITHEAPSQLPLGWAKFTRAIEAAHGIAAQQGGA